MKYFLLWIISLFIHWDLFSQESNRIIFLKDNKKNRILKNWAVGDDINFQISNYQWVQGRLIGINKNSVFIKYYKVNYTLYKGIDTIWYNTDNFLLSEIIAFPLIKNQVNIFNSGVILKSTGALFGLISSINGLINGKFTNDNWVILGISSGLFLIGEIQHLLKKTKHTLGKRYEINIL